MTRYQHQAPGLSRHHRSIRRSAAGLLRPFATVLRIGPRRRRPARRQTPRPAAPAMHSYGFALFGTGGPE